MSATEDQTATLQPSSDLKLPNILGNRTHCKQNGRQGKGSGSYFDSAVVAASYSCLSVPWSFAVLPSHF